MVFPTLESTFGPPSSKAIGGAIAKKFYTKLDLTYLDDPGRTLLEYVEEANIKLRKGEGQP
jgi:hypothetical protein